MTFIIVGVVGNCDIVMVYNRFGGTQGTVAVDIFRVKHHRIVEHWDILQDEVPANQTVSKNPMFTLL